MTLDTNEIRLLRAFRQMQPYARQAMTELLQGPARDTTPLDPGQGRHALADQIVTFDNTGEPRTGDQVLVVHFDGRIALATFRGRYEAQGIHMVTVDAEVPRRFHTTVSAILIGVVTGIQAASDSALASSGTGHPASA